MTRGGDIDIFERRITGQLAIDHRILRHTAGDTDVRQTRPVLQMRQDMKDKLLRDPLYGSCHVLMIVSQRLILGTGLSEFFDHVGRIQWRYHGDMIIPIGDDPAFSRTEETQIEPEKPVGPELKDLPQPVHIDGFAVWRQPHDLVFIAIMREPEQLSKRGIEKTDAMRKVYGIEYGK